MKYISQDLRQHMYLNLVRPMSVQLDWKLTWQVQHQLADHLEKKLDTILQVQLYTAGTLYTQANP